MYINPFIAGVLCTIMLELVIVVITSLTISKRNRKGGKKNG